MLRKVLFGFLLILSLCACSNSNKYPPWLPTEYDYLRHSARYFEYSVQDGSVVESEILFSVGEQHLKGYWKSGENKPIYSSAKQQLTTIVSISSLPNIVQWTNTWMEQHSSDYTVRLHPIDHTTDIPQGETFALMNCQTGEVSLLNAPHTTDDVQGALVITDDAETVLWKIYLILG